MEIRFWKEKVTVSLTPLQAKTIMTILGLNVSNEGYSSFTDDTLEKFWNMDENPLKLYKYENNDINNGVNTPL